jgi:H+/Cl- antiporter ClcA
MLVFYFCGAAVIAGSALSTGLFVPMLVIGCLIGVCNCFLSRCGTLAVLVMPSVMPSMPQLMILVQGASWA